MNKKKLPKLKSSKTKSSALKRTENDLYLVRRDILPKEILKTAKVNEMIKRGETLTIKDALFEFDLSPSTYRRCRDMVTPFYDGVSDNIITLLIVVENYQGILAKILSIISRHLCDIITINQSFPINGMASINISIDIRLLNMDIEKFIDKIRAVNGIRQIELLGSIKQ
ncbi:MAG: ACT domain-containing protein [Selenomonadaceae bacterium]|nr:ACT domain-containing protein [Selenomonadaceae bacterium]